MAEIVLDGVTKRYPDGTVAVHELDLEIADGEFVILVGPSGCGKTTTLNMIAGLEDITQGVVRIGGAVVNDMGPKDRDIAMVFQDYALYPHMTVRENLAFPLKMARTPADVLRRKVADVADTLGLAGMLDRKPAQLSGGQRQRVAMGRAIVRDPRAFLMDEPLSNLDARLRLEMRTQLSRLQKRLDTTTVYVTHDQTEAMTLGDRVALLRAGYVQQVGTPRELYDRPANLFVAGFIGAPAMNLLPATVEDDRLRTPLGPVPLIAAHRRALAAHDAGREVVVGLRPEALEHAGAGNDTGVTVTAAVDIIESTGADMYAYLFLEDGEPAASAFMELTATDDAGSGGSPDGRQLVARLDPDTPAREGEPIELRFDPRKLHLFDPRTGIRIPMP
ncbi:MAG TPA: sn-glycerol-3-phosphate ABC transporter ATP-binding protein UgpC [Gemmatimonadales bacterium]|jgi:multiple sugar transport system ATP-binding protein|nr:sn-glycerol-3-phosphate ABC transporter ATP-binding protein UgpC [Gemmatimonadales bacterium]